MRLCYSAFVYSILYHTIPYSTYALHVLYLNVTCDIIYIDMYTYDSFLIIYEDTRTWSSWSGGIKLVLKMNIAMRNPKCELQANPWSKAIGPANSDQLQII